MKYKIMDGNEACITDNFTEVTKCMNAQNINGYPFIEIFNGHTAIPYQGW